MADDPGAEFPFNLAAIAEDMQQRFGWTNQDMGAAMSQLVPAAMTGFKHFGPGAQAFAPFLSADTVPPTFFNPIAGFGGVGPASAEAGLSPFFGPEFVQKALADQIAQNTGLKNQAIQEMMPVAATLAMGQVARPYLTGEAQTLLDAFMRGFARGRPKPAPKAADFVQSYTDAVNAFWSGFSSIGTAASPQEPEVDTDETGPMDTEGDTETGETGKSEIETMVKDWVAAGQDIQSQQVKAFDALFNQATENMMSGQNPEDK